MASIQFSANQQELSTKRWTFQQSYPQLEGSDGVFICTTTLYEVAKRIDSILSELGVGQKSRLEAL